MVKSLYISLLFPILLGYLIGCSKTEYTNGSSNLIKGGAYFVASWGNDADSGSFEKPWGTWQKAFETAKPGDTVYFRGGVWYPTSHSYYYNSVACIAPYDIPNIGYDGKPDSLICYFNYPGETPILDCSKVIINGKYSTGVNFFYTNFLHFKGLTIRNVYQPESGEVATGIGGWTCGNMTFENLTVHDIGGRGYSYFAAFGIPAANGGPNVDYGYDSTRWINCDAYNCADMLSEDPGNGADGWKIQNYPGSYFYLEGCRAWTCTDDGFDMSGPMVGVFNNCWSFSHGFEGALDGNGFKIGAVWDSITMPSRIVHNCIAAFNNRNGFGELEFSTPGFPLYRNNSRIFNNIAYKNSIGFSGSGRDDNPQKPWLLSKYYNNISYGSTGKTAIGIISNVEIAGIYTESHNSWDCGEAPTGSCCWGIQVTDTVTITDEDFVSLIPSGLSGPRQSDGSLPNINFLKLAKGSDLIDAGVEVVLPEFYKKKPGINGIKPDMGAFESNY